MRLSENFTLEEFIKSQTAMRHGIPNFMEPTEVENAKALCKHVLQPIRDKHGPTVISSGFRSKKLNKKIGGSQSSQHCTGEAADIECHSISTFELARWIAENLQFDQLILEFYVPGRPASGWVHVSYSRTKNRQMILTAHKENGQTLYKRGLVLV